MFLKSLTMKGFKSFADPTVLDFEPGITVVVGPNGSGKSNVVDAVTWVLGAQGPRSLRSQKMEDVIFAGTASRPALGRAEVSLTIDNSSGKLPIDAAEITITRILFRSGDSEYAMNGTPCRLLDVQELLSDSGVGRQQHMIIGQGQLDAVLNARPEDRRAVIEEAAGVLKHRRRRERAERRLAATQENLERLGDLVREVRRQIRPLERQAAAARAHATLAAELLALRRHLAGVELTQLGDRRQRASTILGGLVAEERELQADLVALDEEVSVTSTELSSRRDADLASALGRVQGLVERTKGLLGVLRERSRSLANALDAATDLDVVSNLEAEGARLDAELVAVAQEESDLGPERARLAQLEEVLAGDEAAHLAEWGDGSTLASAEEALGRARGRLEMFRRTLEQQRSAADALGARVAKLEARKLDLGTAAETLAARLRDLEVEHEQRVAEAAEAEAGAELAGAAAESAEHQAQEAEQARHRTAARAEALDRALHEVQGAGGREALRDVEGVIGSLVDLIDIEEGWEPAFEAAAGAAVSAVVVDGPDAARRALERLRRQGATGAVLGATRGPGDLGDLPAFAEPLRRHVRARDGASQGVEAVLDALVGGAVRVELWEAAIDLALDRPDLVVVTGNGDRFSRTGWRVQSSGGVVTAAAVEEAERRAVEAAHLADEVTARWRDARSTLDEARRRAASLARAVHAHESVRVAAVGEARRNEEELLRVAAEIDEAAHGQAEASAKVADEERAVREAEVAIGDLEEAAGVAAARAEQASAARASLDARAADLVSTGQQLAVRAAALAERRRVLTDRRREVERRLEGHAEERVAAAARRERIEADARVLERLERVVTGHRERLEALLGSLQADYRSQVAAVRAGDERLAGLRRDRAATEQRLAQLKDRSRTLDLEVAELGLRMETLADAVRRDLGAQPEEAQETPCPELPDGVSADRHATALEEKLRGLGPVNPLALEELSGLEERYQELERQMADIRSARRELQEVVRTLDAQITETFAAAAADVNEHFSTLVAMLFPGGTGRLVMTDPQDLLNTGLEVEVRPSGRNLRRVSLLSGGERSLVALAFLFAVFRSRPSPFYLMDEVEAALDDVNLHRFLALVREFRAEAQLIIVSHQKRTMETGDALYGVTMAPGGSSQVVSQKVQREPEVFAPAG